MMKLGLALDSANRQKATGESASAAQQHLRDLDDGASVNVSPSSRSIHLCYLLVLSLLSLLG